MLHALLTLIRAELAEVPGWFALLVDVSAKATVLLLAAAIATWAFRRGSASGRHLVWSLSVGGAVLLPVLSLLLPSWRIAILPAPAPRTAVAEAPVVAPVAAPAPRTLNIAVVEADPHPLTVITHAPVVHVARVPTRTATPVVTRSAAPSAPPAVTAVASKVGRWTWLEWIAALWTAGFAFALGRMVAARVGVWRLGRSARDVQRHAWAVRARQLATRMGIRRPVRLVETDGVALPMTWGIRRPVVLLPPDAERWSLDRLEMVLLHELAHVKRLDALTQLLAQLCCALYWFHPLAWVAERRMRALREYACDDHVLEAGRRASDYATEMLDIVRSISHGDRLAGATLAMARRSQLEGRLVAILDPHLRRAGFGRLGKGALAAAFAALVLPLAMFQPTAVAQERGPLPRLSREESSRRRESVEVSPGVTPSTPSTPTPPEAPAAMASPAPTVAPAAPAAPAAPQRPAAAPSAPAAAPTAVAQVTPPAPPSPAPAPAPSASRGASAVCAIDGRSQTNIHTNTENGAKVWRALREGPGCSLSLQTRGNVTVDGDDVELSPNSSLVAVERSGGRERKLELRADGSGRLRKSWRVAGEDRLLGPDAREFLTSMVAAFGGLPDTRSNQVVVETRDDEDRRARDRDDERRDEARRRDRDGQLDGRYKDLLSDVKADEEAARQKIERAISDSRSDEELQERLEEIAESHRLAGENARAAYLRATEKMRSDAARADALRTLAAEAPITVETGRVLLAAAAKIRSDRPKYEVLEFLHKTKEHDLFHGPLALEFVNASADLRDDKIFADAMYQTLHGKTVSPEATLRALELTRNRGSDKQKQRVLIEVKDHQLVNDEVVRQYKRVADTIGSDRIRREALESLAEELEDGYDRVESWNGFGSGWDGWGYAEAVEEGARDAMRQAREEEQRARDEERQAQHEAQRARDEERHADQERERGRLLAQREVERFKAESQRARDEAKRLKAEARRIAEEFRVKAEALRENIERQLRDSGLAEELEAQLERELERVEADVEALDEN